jgi:hypothetical protein
VLVSTCAILLAAAKRIARNKTATPMMVLSKRRFRQLEAVV